MASYGKKEQTIPRRKVMSATSIRKKKNRKRNVTHRAAVKVPNPHHSQRMTSSRAPLFHSADEVKEDKT